MQVAGRPFDEATVLRAGDVYERATAWRARRPQLTPGTLPPPFALSPASPAEPLDACTRAMVEACVAQAGLALSQAQLKTMFEAAPHALPMARRLRKEDDWSVEPATAFRL